MRPHPSFAQAPLGFLEQHAANPLAVRGLGHDEDVDPADEVVAVEREHAVDAAQADDLVSERGDDGRLVRLCSSGPRFLRTTFASISWPSSAISSAKAWRVGGLGVAQLGLGRGRCRFGLRLRLGFLARAGRGGRTERGGPVVRAEVAKIGLDLLGLCGRALVVHSEHGLCPWRRSGRPCRSGACPAFGCASGRA